MQCMQRSEQGKHALSACSEEHLNLFNLCNRQPEEAIALTLLCLLTFGATVNSVQECPPKRPTEQTAIKELWLDLLICEPDAVLTRVPTCRKSNFRLLFPAGLKISADDDPNCIGNKWHCFIPLAGWLDFICFFAEKYDFKSPSTRSRLWNPWFQINSSMLTCSMGHCLCRCNHYDFY